MYNIDKYELRSNASTGKLDFRPADEAVESYVADYIKEHRLLSDNGGPVIVALSGGADSVSLLLILAKLGYNCIAAHCNFHLRGKESDRDQAFVEDLCHKLGIKLEITHFDVKKRQKEESESVEMACRSLRYEWFDYLKSKYQAQALATGHHLDDNVETMFLNIIRGTGIAGVAGIAPKNDRRISPLLGLHKHTLEDYLRQKNIGFVTDSTNKDCDVERNILRNKIIPDIIGNFGCGPYNMMYRTVENLREDYDFYEEIIDTFRKKLFHDNTLSFAELDNTTKQPKYLLYKLLKPYGFDRNTCDTIYDRRHKTGFVTNNEKYELNIDRGNLIIRKSADLTIFGSAIDIAIGAGNGVFEIEEVDKVIPTRDHKTIYFDAQVLEGNPEWTIKLWHEGDRMRPFGMKGRSKKLSDILNDSKVCMFNKLSYPILKRNDEIVWFIGLKESDCFRVTKDTKKIIRIRYLCDVPIKSNFI